MRQLFTSFVKAETYVYNFLPAARRRQRADDIPSRRGSRDENKRDVSVSLKWREYSAENPCRMWWPETSPTYPVAKETRDRYRSPKGRMSQRLWIQIRRNSGVGCHQRLSGSPPSANCWASGGSRMSASGCAAFVSCAGCLPKTKSMSC